MKQAVMLGIIAILLFVGLFIGLPWLSAYRSYCSASGYLGTAEGKEIQFVYVDKTHFEAYKAALWLDESLSITGQDGVISCNGRRIDFPKGKNVALVRGEEDIAFVELGDEYFHEDTSRSEIHYILGKIPRFKERDKGMIDTQKVKEDKAIQEEWAAFLGGKESQRQAPPASVP